MASNTVTKASPILITGAGGFVGKNLVAELTARGYTSLLCFEKDDTPETLADYCRRAAFVVHLAGINRPKDPSEFYAGNSGLTDTMLSLLETSGNSCPVLVTSSIQAALDNDYGKSKKQAEDAIFKHGERTGAPVYVFRMEGVFGKWCRPNYKSAVATFCHNIANDLPITVNDPATELELVYIDDLVAELLAALSGRAHRCNYDGLTPVPGGDFCYVPVTHRVALGKIVELLQSFHAQPETLLLPEIPAGSFEKKLYSTYLSYLPPEKISFPLKMNVDVRGSFTELLKTQSCGQFSVNITKPGVTKGQHWHHSKWEFFVVVAGHGLIRERRLDADEVLEFAVSGEKIEAVHMLPGYTHSITNLSKTDDLVTLMWANECFDPQHPDTFYEEV